ncbi:DUF4294 domain-containing protein [Mangrovibacterium lignilyticum]|uniref:DUF4294 domain-containing protein n=1 Tax=Mangrovibacterium lignilyticum TaxID=2668052 RepID=UPI0013D8B561|nr:DUF4294 domain-containing protein [Mangrovibacterium lignilyticum]
MRKLIVILVLVVALGGVDRVSAQEQDSVHYLEGIKYDGDTIPHVSLNPIPVYPGGKYKSKRLQRKYWRLAAKVKKVYPYAKLAAQLLDEYEVKYEAANNPKLRKKYLKEVEQKLFDQYGPELKKLSISEGRILIKLIDRETQHTSYELIKDLKGGVSAFFWQGMARLFGNNLKDEYDPVEEDRMIEEIIFFIEAGVI